MRLARRVPAVGRVMAWIGVGLLVTAQAAVRLPGLFTDHMVLQQGVPLHVWGWADPQEAVTVQFRGQVARVHAGADGTWQLGLHPEAAGGPDTLRVSGVNRVEVQDVVVGEVWVCSGQSNMEWPLSKAFEPQTDITFSDNSNLRLFTVPKRKATLPQSDVVAQWVVSGPATTPGFSAVAFYFGRALQQARRVPVGLIHTSWGGSPAEVWMSEAMLAGNAGYRRDILDAYPAARQRYEEALRDWEKARDAARSAGTAFGRPRPREPWRPSELYNGMIAPLLPYPVRGAIWYQGEGNADRAWQYRTLFADLIRNWRQDWGLADLPFLAVQLAPWDKNRKRSIETITAEPGESNWAELREAQVLATRVLPHVGLAVITDIGDKDDIHPVRKGPVGERLALAAQAIAYGQKAAGRLSPMYKSVRFGRGRAVVTFANAGRGLEARGGDLSGFAVAGADGRFVWAKAVVRGTDRVEVSSAAVPEPVAVRYGWADYPVVNLFNKDGLPASPFRTDDFPATTRPKTP
jgi:sialate O-acetylesterase